MQKSSQHFSSGSIVIMKRDDGTDSTLLRCRATNSRAADAFTTPRLVLTSADRITFLNAVQGTHPFPTCLLDRIASPVSLAAEDTSFAHVRTSSGAQGYVQTKYLVSAAPHQASPKPASAPSSNFCNRVLAVDREHSSFVPIVGLDKASDMTIDGALMHARRGCSKLQGSLSDSDIHVRIIPFHSHSSPAARDQPPSHLQISNHKPFLKTHSRSARPSPLLPACTSCTSPPPTPLALASTTPLPYTRASTYPHHLTINIHTVALSLFLSQLHTRD